MGRWLDANGFGARRVEASDESFFNTRRSVQMNAHVQMNAQMNPVMLNPVKRPRLVLAAMIAGLGLAAAACGSDPATEPDSAPAPTTEPAPAPTTSASAPTSAPEAPPTTMALNFGEDGDEEPIKDLPDPDQVTAPLTGEPAADESAFQHRAVAVKVGNNEARSRPQTGLAEADVVYEELVENFKTRFLAVYHTAIPDTIGPVRSGRTGDIDLLDDLGTPYIVYSGANPTVERALSRAERDGDAVRVGASIMAAPFQRDTGRQAPFNLYFHFDDVEARVGASARVPVVEKLFEYGVNPSRGIEGVAGVTVSYPRGNGRSSTHIWDGEVGGWVRIQDGTLHTTVADGVEVEIAPANVVVARVDYVRSGADSASPHVVPYGRGRAWVLSRGAVHETNWERLEGIAGFRFSDDAGTPVQLAPGPTWVLLANRSGPFTVSEVDLLTVAEARSLLNQARALHQARAAAGG